MTIAEIANILASAGLEFTAREIEDILWLASRVDTPRKRDWAVAPLDPTATDQDIDDLGDDAGDAAGQPRDEAPANLRSETERGPAEQALPLYAQGMKGNIAGSTVRVRGLNQTATPDAFRRALQPFTRRVPSRWQTRLDEEETARRAADTGIWLPVFTPVRERRFDLTLVIEECTSANLREGTLRHLARHFRHYGSLRAVKGYWLLGDSPLRLRALDGTAEYGLDHLNDGASGDGRHLVLFATDGTSTRWRNGSAQAFIHAVGLKASISLLHLLPRDVWRRTLIGEPDVMIHCDRPGAANTRFQTRLPWWMDANEAEGSLPTPVLGLDAASAGTWARAVSALGGTAMPGVLVSHALALIAPTVPPTTTTPDPASVVARYRNMASPAAYRLAVFLSATNPLTVQIMRLIQRTMLPNSGEGELAEFLLGGLVRRASGQDGNGERLYRFRDGIKDELLKALRYSEEERIDRQLRLVGAALESETNAPRDLEVTFPTPTGASSLCDWSLPFAAVSRQILQDIIQPETAPTGIGAVADGPAAKTAPTTLRILHLSNLHFRDRPDLKTPDATVRFGTIWNAYLARIAGNGTIDLVCVSGDLTWTANPAEFAQASQFLDATLAALGVPKNHLFVVPGNHDIRWEPVASLSGNLRLSGGDSIPPASLTGTEEVAVVHAQSNYREWLKRYLPHQHAALRDDRFADFQLSVPDWVTPVRVVGVDSAWIGAIARGAMLSDMQIRALEMHPADGITVAIMHHPPGELLAPSHVQQRLALSGVHLLLHGGRSEIEQTIVEPGAFHMISSGVTLSAPDDKSMGFHVIDFALDAAGGATLPYITAHEWFRHQQRWATVPTGHWQEPKQSQQNSAPSATEASSHDIFVGRGDELQRLRDIFIPTNPRNGRPGRCMIVGATGVGKTALLQQFAKQVWSPGAVVVLSARYGDSLEEQLLRSFRSDSVDALAARMDDGQTLLVIDDVDTPDQMDAAHRFSQVLPACEILLIGRVPLHGATLSLGWEVIALDPLLTDEATRLLRLLLQSVNSAIAESDARAIVKALDGTPSLVRLIAGHLSDSDSAAELLWWLGGNQADRPPAEQRQAARKDFPWLLPAVSQVFENRWGPKDKYDILGMLTKLAHGPTSGFSTSLGLALSGRGGRTSSAALIRRFEYVCTQAIASRLLQQEGMAWRFAAPAIVAWLRARSPKLRESVMRRWSDWLAIRLAAPARSRERPWKELNELPAALLEWIDTCPVEDAERARPVCLPYALAHGPIEAWQHFCERILRIYPVEDAAKADWYFTLAQLAHAKNELGAALEAVDRCLELKNQAPKLDRQLQAAINSGVNLKNRILADQGGWVKSPGRPGHPFDKVLEDDTLPAIRPHQHYLGEKALAATLDARPTTRCIGLVVQALGTGMTHSLASYLAGCWNSGLLKRSRFVVVADRIAVVGQLLHVFRHRPPGFQVIAPRSVNELAAFFQTRHSGIVVTTEQKMRQLNGGFGFNDIIEQEMRQLGGGSGFDDIVVGFALRHPSLDLITCMPAARIIFFGDESLTFMPSPAGELGPVVASYKREDAIREGYLAPPAIRRVELDAIFGDRNVGGRRGGALDSLSAIRSVSAKIGRDWLRRNGSVRCKAVLIAEREQAALRFAEGLSGQVASTTIMAFTGSVAFKREVLADFRHSTESALLLTTAAMAAELHMSGIDVCYVAAQLTPAIQLKIEAFVNRLGPNRQIGEIVDFANNDWGVLGLPT